MIMIIVTVACSKNRDTDDFDNLPYVTYVTRIMIMIIVTVACSKNKDTDDFDNLTNVTMFVCLCEAEESETVQECCILWFFVCDVTVQTFAVPINNCSAMLISVVSDVHIMSVCVRL